MQKCFVYRIISQPAAGYSVAVTLTLMCLPLVQPAYASTYSFTAIDVPGATPGSIEPFDINNNGQITGTYYDGSYHGFLFSGGTYTTLNVPQSVATYAKGISDKGQIVGYYQDSVGTHGFLFSGGTYTTLDGPGSAAFGTHAYGINNKGEIVGYYSPGSPGSPPYQDFLYSEGSYTPLNPPYSNGAINAVTTGINNPGQIVGFGAGTNGET